MKKTLVSLVACCSLFLLVGCGAQPNGETSPILDKGDTANTLNPSDDSNTDNNEVAVDSDPATDALAECITDAGVIMYGTLRCSHCNDQKELFGASFAKINFVDCDASKPACQAAGVQGFPTWKDAAGNAYPGTQPLSTLATIAGCQG